MEKKEISTLQKVSAISNADGIVIYSDSLKKPVLLPWSAVPEASKKEKGLMAAKDRMFSQQLRCNVSDTFIQIKVKTNNTPNGYTAFRLTLTNGAAFVDLFFCVSYLSKVHYAKLYASKAITKIYNDLDNGCFYIKSLNTAYSGQLECVAAFASVADIETNIITNVDVTSMEELSID